jgi:hypothetical protein
MVLLNLIVFIISFLVVNFSEIFPFQIVYEIHDTLFFLTWLILPALVIMSIFLYIKKRSFYHDVRVALFISIILSFLAYFMINFFFFMPDPSSEAHYIDRNGNEIPAETIWNQIKRSLE